MDFDQQQKRMRDVRINICDLEEAMRESRTSLTTLKNRMLLDPKPVQEKVARVRRLQANYTDAALMLKLENQKLYNLENGR